MNQIVTKAFRMAAPARDAQPWGYLAPLAVGHFCLASTKMGVPETAYVLQGIWLKIVLGVIAERTSLVVWPI